MAQKNNRRTEMTKTMLQTSLMELLKEKPLSKITIKEVCENADLNRTTFYLHYTGLDGLFDEITLDAEQIITESIQKIRSEKDQIRSITLLLDYLRQNQLLFDTLLHSGAQSNLQKHFFRRISNFLYSHTTSDSAKRQNRYARAFMINGCLGLITAWFDNGFDISSDALARQIYLLCDDVHKH